MRHRKQRNTADEREGHRLALLLHDGIRGLPERKHRRAEPGYLARGAITKASLKSNGTALLKGNLIVAEPSFCVYDIKTLSGHFNITFQPQTLVIGDVTAALDKKHTLGSSCAASQVMEYRVSFP